VVFSNAVGGVKLQVPPDQVDMARDMLDPPAVLTWLLMGVPLFPIRRRRRWASCGTTLA
jgi:hypothetical protein